MKLGIGTYTYMWSIGFEFDGGAARPDRPMSALELLAKARDLGVGLVQCGPNLPLDQLPGAELEALGSQAQAWDIELELGTRGLDPEHLLAQLDLAERIGAKLLRTVPDSGGKPPARSEITEALKAVAPQLAQRGIRLGLENGNLPARELRQAVEDADSPMIGVVLDTVNSLAMAEGWRYVAEVLAPLTVCLHYKDFTVRRAWHMMGFICEGTPAGQGQLDLPWLLSTLDAAGAHSFNVILELWPPSQASLEETIALEHAWAQASVAYLRQHIPA